MKKLLKIGSVHVSDNTSPKTIECPDGYHCHCAPIVTGIMHKNNKTTLILNGGKPHRHYGKGGWRKNGDCPVCTPPKAE